MRSDHYLSEYKAIDVSRLDAMLSALDPAKPIVLYGAGGQGQRCFSYLIFKKYKVAYFADGNEKLWNDTPFFTEIISPEKLKKIYNGETIIVTPIETGNEIKESLLRQGYPNDKIYLLPFKTHKRAIQMLNPNQHEPADLEYATVAPDSPPVTVVAIIYNTKEHYLRRSIESVIRQTYRDFRYLIIDHGSNDGVTAAIIQEYAERDMRIVAIRTDLNYYNEYVNGRGEVIELLPVIENNIVGEYMCILDSDDYFDDNFLKTTYEFVQTHKVDVVNTGSLLTHEDSTIVSGWRCDIPDCFIAKNNFEKAFMFATGNCFLYSFWSNLSRRDLFIDGLTVAFKPVYGGLISDNKYGFTLLRGSHMAATIGNTLHYYTVHSDSATLIEYRTPAFHLKTILIFIEFINEFLRPTLKNENHLFDIDMLLYNWSSNTISWLVHGMNDNFNRYKLTEPQRIFTLKLFNDILNDPFTVRVINSRTMYRESFFKLQEFLKQNVVE